MRRYLKSIQLKETPTLCIDCRFLTKHSFRGLNLTFLQLQYLMAENRQRKMPWPIYLANYDTENADLIRMENK